MPKLRSFGKLRKTGANLVKRFSDGEVAAVFLCHGQAVEVGRLGRCLHRQAHRQGVHGAPEGGRTPPTDVCRRPRESIPRGTEKGGLNITPGQVNKIKKLRQQGFKIEVICEKTGFSRTTVRRHLKD